MVAFLQTNFITPAAMKKRLFTLGLKQGCATSGPAKISSFLVIIHFKPGSENFFFLEMIMILGRKVGNGRLISSEDLFFRDHYDFGTKSGKSKTDFK